MNIDIQVVINEMAKQIAGYAKQVAILEAQIQALKQIQQPQEEAEPSEKVTKIL
jgi:hypothetical protein